jgi:hypothetical protein
MTLRVVIAGTRLMNPQRVAGLHTGERGRLAPVVTHQGHALASDAIGALVIDGHIQGRQPTPGGARPACVVAHDLFGTTNPAPPRCRPSQSPRPGSWSCRCPPFIAFSRAKRTSF